MTSESRKWYDRTWLVIVLIVFIFPIGLYALWMNSRIATGWKVAITILVGLLVVSRFTGEDSVNVPATSSAQESMPGKGGKLTSDYFEVTLNDATLSEVVSTGNQFADLPDDPGSRYVLLDVTLRNVDTESRMAFAGSLWLIVDGKEYEFDKAETVLADGYGLFLDQINPLTSMRTKLVFKVPSDISGEAYWQPGRSDKHQRFILGRL